MVTQTLLRIVDLLAPLRIGDPAVLERNGAIVYGRICELSGFEYKGERAVVTLLTPGGSRGTIGRFWIRKIANDNPDLRLFEAISEDASYETLISITKGNKANVMS